MNKWTTWYDSLPEHTKQYLKTRPLWHDIDLAKAAAVGAVVGFLIGVIL
jgi:ElaB/YqjD/DUF883 family membrane-anchored ribosome-binding protein